MQRICEKMDLVDLDDAIDAEVLGSFGVTMDNFYFVLTASNSSAHSRDCCRSAHSHLGQHWWSRQSQTRVP